MADTPRRQKLAPGLAPPEGTPEAKSGMDLLGEFLESQRMIRQKTVETLAEAQATQAAESVFQGVPVSFALQQAFGLQSGNQFHGTPQLSQGSQESSAVNQALGSALGPTPNAQAGQTRPGPGIFERGGIDPKTFQVTPSSALFGLIQEHPGNLLQRTQVAQGMQKIAGQEPLQAGKREELGIQGQQELFKEAVKQAQAGLLTPEQLFTAFQKTSQPFSVMQDAITRIEESAKSPSAAGDIALLFGYMKLLDPTSTVREGEFATAQSAGGVPSRVSALYNSVVSGRRLATGQVADFLDRSRRLYRGAERLQRQNIEKFSTLARRSNIDPSVIMTEGSQGRAFASLQEAESAKLPKGTRITVNGRSAIVE